VVKQWSAPRQLRFFENQLSIVVHHMARVRKRTVAPQLELKLDIYLKYIETIYRFQAGRFSV
jgi:hypothetical protein